MIEKGAIYLKIVNNKHNNSNSKPECVQEGVKKRINVNQIISIISHLFVVAWVVLFTFWTKPFLADYYQKMANSHYDNVQWCQMGPVFVVALVLSIHSFFNKKYFVGLLTIIIAIWSFYWSFMTSFSCHACTYGG